MTNKTKLAIEVLKKRLEYCKDHILAEDDYFENEAQALDHFLSIASKLDEERIQKIVCPDNRGDQCLDHRNCEDLAQAILKDLEGEDDHKKK